jgi:hypothetical protein
MRHEASNSASGGAGMEKAEIETPIKARARMNQSKALGLEAEESTCGDMGTVWNWFDWLAKLD